MSAADLLSEYVAHHDARARWHKTTKSGLCRCHLCERARPIIEYEQMAAIARGAFIGNQIVDLRQWDDDRFWPDAEQDYAKDDRPQDGTEDQDNYECNPKQAATS